LLETELGPPALADCLAVFECARETVMPGGDHSVLIGRVLRFHRPEQGVPLVFFRGRYSGLA
jgi:flavin reductase (DIM6/NTAB) family NADH-FMN oxidoreductase RutF